MTAQEKTLASIGMSGLQQLGGHGGGMVGGGALSGGVGASGKRHRLRKGSKNSGATQAGSGVLDGAAVIVCWNC